MCLVNHINLLEVIVVMFLYNTGRSCHWLHVIVAHNCYELQIMPSPTPHCYVEHDNQRPYNTHCDTEMIKKDSFKKNKFLPGLNYIPMLHVKLKVLQGVTHVFFD